MRYPVNEWFVTIQGEAAHTGRPSFFVRLQGCPVGCGWCDTKYTWPIPGREAPGRGLENMGRKALSNEFFGWGTADEILSLCPTNISHVVLTGGEPAMYDLTAITTAVIESGRSVQIETSGTFPIQAHPDAWITLSPKIGMAGGLKVLAENVWLADEIKMPVGKARDVAILDEAILPHVQPGTEIWLQPLSQGPGPTKLCVQVALDRGWRVSAQVHKYLGLA